MQRIRFSGVPAVGMISVCIVTAAWHLGCRAADATDTPDATQLPHVQVVSQPDSKEGAADSGYRNSSGRSGFLGRTSLQDTPYSLNVTSGELIENTSAHTVSDALKTNPTVSSLMESTGYTSMSRVMVRGFTAADQDFRDGLVDRSFAFVPLENVERIEVLNGVSSFLYGFSALGGSVNYISKQPTGSPYVALAVGQYGGGINYLHGDLGGPAGDAGQFGYRVNLYDEHGDTYLSGSRQDRHLASGVLNFKLGPDTLVHLDAWNQGLTMNGLATYLAPYTSAGVSYVPDASQFSARTQYGQNWTYNKADKTVVGIGIESALTNALSVRAAYRYGDMWREYLYVAGTLTNPAGTTYAEKAWGTTRQTERTHSYYALLDADFETIGIAHKVSAGFTGTNYLYTRGDDKSTSLGSSATASPANYANPNLGIGPTNVWYQQYFPNLVLGDQIRFNEAWSAIAGVTRAKISLDRWGSGTALAAADYDQSKTTPSLGVVYKPMPTLSLYASYMEGLVNGGTAPATAANANQILGPSVSDQVEIGAKGSYAGVDMTAALFRINKVNEYTDPNDNVYKQDGREVHQGLEFTATGKLDNRLTVVGGFTALDAYVARAKNNPALVGKIPVNVPERQARLHLEYALPDVTGLILTGGADFSGRRSVDALNTGFLAGATTWDIGARYLTHVGTHRLTLIANVSNLFDKAYWTYYRSGDGLLLGEPRVISVTAKTEW